LLQAIEIENLHITIVDPRESFVDPMHDTRCAAIGRSIHAQGSGGGQYRAGRRAATMRPMQSAGGWNEAPRGDHAAVRPSRLSRLASLAAACVLSLALLVIMTPAGMRISEPPFAAGAQAIMMLQQRPPPQPSPMRAVNPRPREALRKPPSRRDAAAPAATAAAEPAQAPAAADTASITPPQTTASGPLRLDGSVLRQAAGQSKSAVQQMADASGQSPDTQRATDSEKLAGGVERAGKPDCLAPGGGDLRETVARIYQTITAKCKLN
jgi:hypothetical protein